LKPVGVALGVSASETGEHIIYIPYCILHHRPQFNSKTFSKMVYPDTQQNPGPLSPTTSESPPKLRTRFGILLRSKTLSKRSSFEDSTESSDFVLPKPTLRRCKSEGNTDSSRVRRRCDKPSVSFGSIEIREHGRVLVDHPSCADGLALGLDWKHAKKTIVTNVDAYEMKRTLQGKRSNKRARVLSSYDKSMLLMKVGGYKEKELTDALRTASHQVKEKELSDAFLLMSKQNKKLSAHDKEKEITLKQNKKLSKHAKEKEVTDTFFTMLKQNKKISTAA
jgi:hypothetical protein